MQSRCRAKVLLVGMALLMDLAAAGRTGGAETAIDAEQFRRDIAALCPTPSRVIGTSGYQQAQQYLRSQIAALGSSVELREQDFPAMAPVTESASIDLGGGRIEKVYPFWPAALRVCSTPPEGISGKLVYAGECRFDQIKPASMNGAIAVIEASAGRSWRQAFYFGARAAIVLGSRDTNYRDLSDHELRIPVNFPRFYLPPGALADELRRGAISGEATVRSRMTWRRVAAKNYFVLVPPATGSATGKSPAPLMISVPYDSSGLVPDVAPGASQAVQTACGLAILREVAKHPWNRPVLLFLSGADSLNLLATRQMFLALAEAPATWRDELTTLNQEVASTESDLSRATELRDRPQSLNIRRDRSLLDRIVKLIDTDLAVEQDQLFRVRAAQATASNDELRRLEDRQIRLNALSFAFRQHPADLAGSDFSADARAAMRHVIEQLGGDGMSDGLIAHLRSRAAQLNSRIDLYRWLATAIGRNPEPERRATNERVIELLVGIDLSDDGTRAGPMFFGNLQRASNISQIQDYRDWFSRAQAAFAAGDASFKWWGDVTRTIDIEPLNQSRTPQTFLCAPLGLGTELAQAWGVPGFSMVTLDDLRLRRDTPADTLENLNVDAIVPQLVGLRDLLEHACNDPTFRGPVELKRFETSITGQVVSAAPGRPVPDLPRPGFLATYYVINNKDRKIPTIRPLPWVLGVRRSEVADCDALGRYRFEGLPRLVFDPLKPTDPMLYAINVYRVDQDSGAITATTDLGKQAGDIKWWADIRQDVSPLRSLVFNCEEFSLCGLYDPRYLQSLTDVIPLDARRNADPQRYGMWLFDEMLGGFVEPGARMYLPIRYGRVGNRMLLINTAGGDAGFSAEELNRLGPLALATAQDFSNLDDRRLAQYRKAGVSSTLVDALHATSNQELARADGALKQNLGVEFARESAGAWADEARVYDAAQDMARDVIRGAIFLLLLCVPFAFCIERLLIASPNVYRQITGVGVIFAIMMLALWSFHPAFKISSSPMIIVMAFAIIFMSAAVIVVVYGKFDAELKRIRSGKGYTAESGLARASVMTSAILLGISNMRRRKFRTALTSITIVLITFALLCFTGATSYVGTTTLSAGVPSSHPGIMLRQRGFRPMPLVLVDYLKTVLADPRLGANGTQIVERWWNVFATDPRQQTDLVSPTKVVAVQALLGLSPGESRLSAIGETIGAEKFARLERGERDIIYLPRSVAQQLGVSERDRIRVGGITVEVAGIYDPDLFDQKVRMLSGEPIAPLRYSTGALDTGGRKLDDITVESLDLGPGGVSTAELGGTYEHLSASQFAIVPAELSKLLPDAYLRSVAFRLKDQTAVSAVADELARRLAVAIFAGYDDGVRMVAAGNLTQVSGAGQVAIPLAIAGLIIFNTMMGSISERRREIHVYTSLGLAPMHVGALFLAEAAVYGLIGTVFGYIVGQGAATVMSKLGWLGNITLNYSGTAAMLTMGLVLAIVLLSAIYPARVASRVAAPSIERTWQVPLPEGNRITAILPFTINKTAADGALAYLADFFDAHREGSIGKFSVANVETFTLDNARGIRATIWLTPFDLGVRQDFTLLIRPSDFADIYEVHVVLERLSGDDRSWHRMNRPFLTELRKQFLQWRTISPQRMMQYVEDSRRLFSAAPASAAGLHALEVAT